MAKPSIDELLSSVLGNNNVYFQPPESVKMSYPAIRYTIRYDQVHADNITYKMKIEYELILIDKNPDSIYVSKLLEIPYCKYTNSYSGDNLNHFTFTLFY